jgi:uncharacterized protein
MSGRRRVRSGGPGAGLRPAAAISPSRAIRVGVIADTHGLVRPEALAGLAGSELIVHAGDVGGPDVLDALRAIAPVVAVRGNNDRGAWAQALAEAEILDLGGARIYLIHDVAAVDFEPRAAGFAAVIAGHSHKPRCEARGGVLWFNPGSAGPRRFTLPVAVGRLRIASGRVRGEIVELTVSPPTRGRARRSPLPRAQRILRPVRRA